MSAFPVSGSEAVIASTASPCGLPARDSLVPSSVLGLCGSPVTYLSRQATGLFHFEDQRGTVNFLTRSYFFFQFERNQILNLLHYMLYYLEDNIHFSLSCESSKSFLIISVFRLMTLL